MKRQTLTLLALMIALLAVCALWFLPSAEPSPPPQSSRNSPSDQPTASPVVNQQLSRDQQPATRSRLPSQSIAQSTKTWVVSGRAVNELGQGMVANVRLELLRSEAKSSWVATEEDGSFALQALRDRDLKLELQALGFTPRIAIAQGQPLRSDVDVGDVVLFAAGELRGRFVSESGHPVAEKMRASLTHGTPSVDPADLLIPLTQPFRFAAFARIDSFGCWAGEDFTFATGPIRKGRWKLGVRHQAFELVSPLEVEVAGIEEIQIVVRKVPTISGTLRTESGAPLREIKVIALGASGFKPLTRALTKINGTFLLGSKNSDPVLWGSKADVEDVSLPVRLTLDPSSGWQTTPADRLYNWGEQDIDLIAAPIRALDVEVFGPDGARVEDCYISCQPTQGVIWGRHYKVEPGLFRVLNVPAAKLYVAVQPLAKNLRPSALIPWDCRDEVRKLTVKLDSARTVSVVARDESGGPVACSFVLVGHRSDANARTRASYAHFFRRGGFQFTAQRLSGPSAVFDTTAMVKTGTATLRTPWPEYPVSVLWVRGKGIRTQALRMPTADIPDVWQVEVSQKTVSVRLRTQPIEVTKAITGAYLRPLGGESGWVPVLPAPGSPKNFNGLDELTIDGAWPGPWQVLLTLGVNGIVHEAPINIESQSGTVEFELKVPDLAPGWVEVHDPSGRYRSFQLFHGSVYYKGATVRDAKAAIEHVLPGDYPVFGLEKGKDRVQVGVIKVSSGELARLEVAR